MLRSSRNGKSGILHRRRRQRKSLSRQRRRSRRKRPFPVSARFHSRLKKSREKHAAWGDDKRPATHNKRCPQRTPLIVCRRLSTTMLLILARILFSHHGTTFFRCLVSSCICLCVSLLFHFRKLRYQSRLNLIYIRKNNGFGFFIFF